MTCTGVSGFQFIERPAAYPRDPFQLASGELVGFEGRFYSYPAYALLADIRLMTIDTSHPITNPFKLYINRNTPLSITIEPRPDASGYENATPHYDDYVTDMRTAVDTVTALHAADSDHSAALFKATHLRTRRFPYDINSTTASGVSDGNYVHPNPTTTVPSGNELGAKYMQDIDMDEVMWNPFTRPKNRRLGINNIPIEPVFPAVLSNGNLPAFSSLDDELYGILGLGAQTSGGLIITGDRLLAGTSIKLLTASGEIGAQEGDFIEGVQWALFPSKNELCRYYITTSSGVNISASGRQAIYNIPDGLPDDSVLLLDVSNIGTSGEVIQTYPGNYEAPSGVRASNRTTHNGVHNVGKLLYDVNNLVPAFPTAGRSPINGATVFGHFVGRETGSKGQTSSSAFVRYAHDDDIFGYGGIKTPRVSNNPDFSLVEWFSTNQLFSPLDWELIQTSALQPAVIGFSQIVSVVYDVGDTNFAPEDGVVTRKIYVQNGTIDQVVFPDQDRALGGQKTAGIITYETHTYQEGTGPNGEFIWVEESGSPTFSTQTYNYFADTYYVNNIFGFFFFRNARKNFGFVNVNGHIYFQWSEQSEPTHKFAPLGARTSTLYPTTNYRQSITSVGFFPNWRLRLVVTTNNQITLPQDLNISPAASELITFAPELGLAISNIQQFGPAVWDPENNINYIYFQTKVTNQFFFAKMNTDFQIIEMNRVSQNEAILTGRLALLSI